jgi:hypothetical protein
LCRCLGGWLHFASKEGKIENHMITRKERNFSGERIAVIMPKVEKLEVENQISFRQSVPLSEMRSLHSRFTQFKGEMFKWNLRFG